MDARETIDAVTEKIRQEFDAANRILTLEAYLDLFLDAPYRLARSAPQYVADMFDHFGTREAECADGKVRRFRLFDQEFRNGEGRVFGQEHVHERIYRLIRAAADEGRTEKLLLMHGPNGSGKSVIVEAMFRGLEQFSRVPEGALYRFNWVFARPENAESLGFGAGRSEAEITDLALLEGEEIAARLVCELKDHPLFVIPKEERRRLLDAALERNPDDGSHSFRWILEGELCQKCKGIYEGLLASYQGDWERLVSHVQVERYFVSQRFRSAAVTILPMASVDAAEAQITADMSLQNLPPVLQNLKIFEPFGDLVDANGGVVEFGDFLKRHMDMNKYLLNAVEKGTIGLTNSLVHLNLVMLGTSNEKHLDAFKTTPEWTSFKGRIELIPVPYLLEYKKEAELYEDLLSAVARDVHVAPHTFDLAGLWAVLTRLLRPDTERLQEPLAEIAGGLTPMEKAHLYQDHAAPVRMERDEGQILLAGVRELRKQHRESVIYEGRFGASAREMRMVLNRAAYDPGNPCLTPTLLFKSLRDLVKDKTVYDFLKLKESSRYHDPEGFIDELEADFAKMVLEEIQDSMELVFEAEYDRRFDEYMENVISSTKGESVRNPQTGATEPPNEQKMRAVEDLFNFEEPRETWRKNLVARIGAWGVDHPGERPEFRNLFPDLLKAVRADFFKTRKEGVDRVIEDLLKRRTDDYKTLPEADRNLVETVLGNLEKQGYCAHCAHDAATFLRGHFPEG